MTLEKIAAHADAGLIRAYVQTLPLADVGKAHAIVAAGGVQGKVVLTLCSRPLGDRGRPIRRAEQVTIAV